MDFSIINNRDFSKEFIFSASRSSGPGGQNVNKVNSKVELRFSLEDSKILLETEKALLINSLSKYLNSRGELIIVSQTERSQLKNKEKCIVKFYFLLSKGLFIKKKRRPTTPSKSSKVKRMDKKRIASVKKNLRRQNFNDEY